jgi:hypothetical protein
VDGHIFDRKGLFKNICGREGLKNLLFGISA